MRKFTSVLFALTLLFGAPFAVASEIECVLTTGGQPSLLKAPSRLAVRLFRVSFVPAFRASYLEDFRIHFAEVLVKELRRSSYFKTVRLLPDDERADYDMELTGEFSLIALGSNTLIATLTRSPDIPSVLNLDIKFSESRENGEWASFQCQAVCGTDDMFHSDKGTPRRKVKKCLSGLAKELASRFRKASQSALAASEQQ